MHLELKAIEEVAVPDIPLPATTGQSRSAVNEALLIHTEHAHLGHCADKCSVPCAFAECESGERKHGNGMLGNALVRGKCEWRFAALGLLKILVVPSTDSAVELLWRVGGCDALLGCGVSTEQSCQIDGREAF